MTKTAPHRRLFAECGSSLPDDQNLSEVMTTPNDRDNNDKDNTKDKNQLRQNERDNDKFLERQQHTVGPPVTQTEEALRQEAEDRRRKFIEEHRKCQEAEAKAKELKAKLEAIQEKEHKYEEELNNLREELEQTREEKDNMLRMTRSLKKKLGLAKEKDKDLQARLRELEKEMRDWRNPMYNAPRAPSPWACPRCTLDNTASASKCKACEEPRPVSTVASSWLIGNIVCDDRGATDGYQRH